MTKPEVKAILQEIAYYEKCAEEEMSVAEQATDEAVKANHYQEAKLNSCSATALNSLLNSFIENGWVDGELVEQVEKSLD